MSMAKLDDLNLGSHLLPLSPSLANVTFKAIDLFIKGDELTCLPNYFMPFDNIRFVKE